jgi:regulatory protein
MTESELFKASLNRAMALCASREYCVSEIHDKLIAWGLSEKESTIITDRLKKENFINEERYAVSFVKDKFRYNKWGRVKIAAHLRVKKIPSTLTDLAMNSIDNDTYRKALEDLLCAHRRTVKARNTYDLKGKLMRYGLSKGFESQLLYDILNDPDE